MENPFDQINRKLDTIIARVDKIEIVNKAPLRIPFKDFCQQRDITRPTGYNWADKGLIQLEKVGGRQYVKADSITVTSKYQRDIK